MLVSDGGSRSVATDSSSTVRAMMDTTERVPPVSDDIVGMTLVQYAAARGLSAQAAREEYAMTIRTGAGLRLPTSTRCDREDSVMKFCLPVAPIDGGPGLETE